MTALSTRRLRTKLIFTCVILLLAPIGVICYLNARANTDTLIQKVGQEELASLINQTHDFEQRLNGIKNDLLFLAQAPPTVHYVAARNDQADSAALQNDQVAFFSTFLSRVPGLYKEFDIVDLNGQEGLKVDGAGQLLATDPAQSIVTQAYFDQAIGLPANQVYVSDVDLNRTGGQIDTPYLPILYFSAPIQVNGKTQAVLVAKVALNPLLDGLTASAAGDTLVITRDGSYLVNPDPAKLYGTLLHPGISSQNDSSQQDVLTMYGNDHGSILSSADAADALQLYAQIKPEAQTNIHWLVIHNIPLSSILGEANNTLYVVALLTLLAAVIVIAVISGLAGSLVRPILQLTQAIDTLRQGNWDGAAVPSRTLHRKDEVGQLASMVEHLRTDLKARYSELETRLDQNTAELTVATLKLNEAQRKVDEASRAKSRYFSAVSHELLTPLNVMVGYAHSMLTMPSMFNNVTLPDAYQPYVKLIEDHGDYLVSLINDILDLSKIEAGKLELLYAAVDLPDLFRAVMSTITGLHKDKTLQICADYPVNLPLVWADPIRVRQIVLNLLSNAARVTETGGITLKAEVVEDRISISVIDTNDGLCESAEMTLFDPVQRISGSTNGNIDRAGFGLDISKQLSQMHGGDLTMSSREGKANAFAFSLPLATADQIATAKPQTVADQSFSIFQNSTINPEDVYSILLVEDEISMRELVRRTLEAAGYLVVDASDGAEVMDLATGILPNLIILDVNLPHVNGWDLIRQLKMESVTQAIPIIIYTASPDHEQALQLGAAALIRKPAPPEAVVKAVRETLHIQGELPGRFASVDR